MHSGHVLHVKSASASNVQGQLLHTCIMQAAGSHHVMELLTEMYNGLLFQIVQISALMSEFLSFSRMGSFSTIVFTLDF